MRRNKREEEMREEGNKEHTKLKSDFSAEIDKNTVE